MASAEPEHGVAAREVAGFVGSITTIVCYVLFLAWAFTPEETMRALGVTYYPAKWWALAAPSWLCALVVYVYVAYGSLNLLSVVPPASLRAVTDRDAALTHGRESPVPGGLPPAGDVPLSEVCALLHAARTAP